MKHDNNRIKYFVYCRKSTESKEKQVLSIITQKEKAKEMFSNLEIVAELEEEKSAFHPYVRPVFKEMIERIKNGEAQGIIAWHPDRLSRNPTDAGTIAQMIVDKEILDLKFGSYHFDNSPEGIMYLQNALSYSQYDSAKKGVDVKRGLEKKLKMGWMPGVAPPGYLNDKTKDRGERDIMKDPERFSLVRKMWDLMLTGKYTPPQILKIVNEEWGYKTPKRRILGGKRLSRSIIYKIFTNLFYCREFEYQGKIWEGSHEPMITKEEFDRVQFLLGRKGRPRPQKHNFPFAGQIRCEECGAMITVEEKWKRQKNGNVHHYVYYHCTKKKNPNCAQGSVEIKELEKQIDELLSKIEINEKYKDLAIEYLNETNDKEVESRESIRNSQKKEYDHCLKELDNLLKLKISPENNDGSLLSNEEYKNKKAELIGKKIKLEEVINDTGQRVEKWMIEAEKVYDFACFARIRFAKGDPQTKSEILSALGQNLLLKDRKLAIQLQKPFKIIGETLCSVPEARRGLEPAKIAQNERKTALSGGKTNAWLRW